jgi:hypothetical protein
MVQKKENKNNDVVLKKNKTKVRSRLFRIIINKKMGSGTRIQGKDKRGKTKDLILVPYKNPLRPVHLGFIKDKGIR